jgi:hypothetical protein
MAKGILSVVFAFVLLSSFAQDQFEVVPDSAALAEKQDTVLIESYTKRFNPRKALFLAAVFPGMGQAYNNAYWKLPIVYGGFYAGIYVVSFYQKSYLQYKGQLFDLLNDPTITTSPSGFNQEQLRTLINKTRRQRDYFSILTGLWYILQIVDAHVDAHLKEFKLNPQLHVKLEPMVESDQLTGRNSGVSLKFKFR